LIRTQGPGERAKIEGVLKAFPCLGEGPVLDVGCRSRQLATLLKEPAPRYVGIDIQTPADVIASVDRGLPFAERSFDSVVALDVLEHTDDIHTAIAEVCRVSRRFVVISLPNMYLLEVRLRFLLGRPLSGKYGLPVAAQADRHRWLFTLEEARHFCRECSRELGFRLAREGCLIGPRRRTLLGPAVVRVPGILCPTYLVLLERR